MLKRLPLLIFLLFVAELHAQDRVTSLFGFALGQYAEAGRNELGEPLQEAEDNEGYAQEIFLLKVPDSIFVVLEQYKEAETINSIQVTSADHVAATTFKGLSIGADIRAVEKVLGKASVSTPVKNGYELLDYEGTNYSLEMKDGKLFSIKIWQPEDNETPQVDKLPAFKDVVKILQKGSNSEIAAILSPDMEVYNHKETYIFAKSMKTEIEKDVSGIFAMLKETVKGLDKINIADPDAYEENIRLTYGDDTKHVVKIKKGHKIKEIVFKYGSGKWRIWEIMIDE